MATQRLGDRPRGINAQSEGFQRTTDKAKGQIDSDSQNRDNTDKRPINDDCTYVRNFYPDWTSFASPCELRKFDRFYDEDMTRSTMITYSTSEATNSDDDQSLSEIFSSSTEYSLLC